MARDLPVDIQGISPRLIAAAQERAELQATLLGQMIEKSPYRDVFQSGRFSRSMLMDLGIAAQIGHWEACGMTLHLDHGLPSFEEALHSIALQGNGADYERSPGDTLAFAVFKFSMKHITWASQHEWGVDLALGDIDEELLLDVFSESLWNHRTMTFNSDGEPSHES